MPLVQVLAKSWQLKLGKLSPPSFLASLLTFICCWYIEILISFLCVSLMSSLRWPLYSSPHRPAVYIGEKNRLMTIGSTSKYSSSRIHFASNDDVGIDNLDEEMVAFFHACRRPILTWSGISIEELTLDEGNNSKAVYGIGEDSTEAYKLSQSVRENNNKTLIKQFTRDEESITKVVYGIGEDSIDAYVLPKSVLKWPSFYDSKQKNTYACEVLCVHTDMMNSVRRKMIVDYVLLGYDSITMGPAGIGKSSESNFMLLEFLRNIGEEGYPRHVLYRIPDKCVFEFSLDAGNKPVAKRIPNTETIGDVYRITTQYNRKNSVIIFEVAEHDIDPKSKIPCIVTASSRDIDNTFKTMTKGGAMQFLSEPASAKQLKEQMKAIKLLSEDSGEFKTLSLKRCLEIIEERVSIVGPVSRYVFSSDYFVLRKKAIDDGCTPFFNVLDELSVKNIADNAKYYIAPFFKEGSTIPKYSASMPDSSDIYTFEFLSPYCQNAIANSVKTAKIVELLRHCRDKLDFQIAEGIMIQSLFEKPPLMYNFPDECSRDHWVIHNDPGYNGKISKKNLLSEDETNAILNGTLMRWASEEQVFSGMYCTQDVTDLREGVVYRSRTHNFALGDSFMVNHGTKEIWFFQSTVMDPAKHPFSVATIKTVMEKLNMLDGRGEKYQLVILVFTDKMRKTNHGCKFVYEKTKKNVVEKAFTLPELKKSSEVASEIMTRVKTYVVLSVYYPNLQRELDSIN